MIRPVKAPGFIFAAVLLLSGCSRVDETEIAAQVGESHARTVSTLAELPPELRRHLLDRFDWRQDRRTVPAESRAVREREIITDERSGFLVAADDPAGYARRLKELFNDPAAAATLTITALDHIRAQHTWEVFMRRLREVYDG